MPNKSLPLEQQKIIDSLFFHPQCKSINLHGWILDCSYLNRLHALKVELEICLDSLLILGLGTFFGTVPGTSGILNTF